MLDNLSEISDVLQDKGYTVCDTDGDVLKVNILDAGPSALLIIEDGINGKELRISYQVLTLGQLLESPEFAIALLDMNSSILPFSFASVSVDPGDEVDIESSPVMLMDSIPIGNMCEEELLHSIQSLLIAYEKSAPLLRLINGAIIESSVIA